MFRPPLLIACGLLVGVLPSLASAQWEVPMGQTPFGPHVRWTTLGEGLDSEIKTAEWRVLGNEMEWRNHFSRMLGRPLQANEQIPAGADWNRQLLVAIHAGPKLGNGWRVYVETIGRSSPGFWDIQVVQAAPPQTPGNNQRVRQHPWVVIQVDRPQGSPRLFSRNTVAGFQVLAGPAWGWCGNGEAPAYRLVGGQLVPLNDAARRRMGLDVDRDKRDRNGRDRFERERSAGN